MFARCYVYLIDTFLNSDRAPETSVVRLTVQLLTTPTVSAYLAERHQFFNTLMILLRWHFLPDMPADGDNERSIDAHINCNSPAFTNRRFTQIFESMRYMLGSPISREVIGRDSRALMGYLELLNLFQGMNPQTRAIDRHVEYESEAWMNAFQVTMLMARCVQPMAQCYARDAATLAGSLRRVLRHISVWGSEEADSEMETAMNDEHRRQAQGTPEMHSVKLAGQTYQVVKYVVSRQSISFHNPMHWLLAEMLRFVDLLDDEVLRQAGWRNFRNVIFGFYHNSVVPMDQMITTTLQRLQGIFDYAIRGK
jgi:E3 ubiquitin-protein ligase UBR1